MTLQQLHQVITIAESRSMNEASRKLFVSQPNLSAVVRELEEETGYASEHLEPLISIVTAIAFCDEVIDIYLVKPRNRAYTGGRGIYRICQAGRGAVSFAGIPLYFVCIQKEIFCVHAALYLCGQGICGSGQGCRNGRI